jgi:uncharacterized protein YjiS (DUF1127 family)
MAILMEKNLWIPILNNFGKSFLQSLGRRGVRYFQLAQQRRALLELDAHQLNDIGINRVEAVQLARSSWFSDKPLISDKKQSSL